MMYQQGDVLITRVGEVEGKKIDSFILAEGEATGHNHQVAVKDREKVTMFERNGTLYMKVVGDSIDIVHEEHGTITIPKGDYVIGRVREFDHFLEEAKRVQD